MNTNAPIPTREGYDRWSEVYDEDANPLIALEQPVFDALLGDVADQQILDVGCGTGRHSIRLAQRGACVTGTDFSQGMLDKARAQPGASAINFVHHDLTTPFPFDEATFDLVTCALVLDHIHDLPPFFAQLRTACKPSGRIVATVMHPAMALKGVQARFNDPTTGDKIHVDSATNSIADYVTAILAANLKIDHIAEHAPDEALAARFPRAEPYVGYPMLLAMRLLP